MIIKSINHLKKQAKNGLDVSILLGGSLKSSKYITYINGKFEVLNYIDDTTQILTAGQLTSQSNIAEAINKHALITN